MPRRYQQSPYQLTLWDQQEIERCATHIREDLGLETRMGLDVMDIAVVHGGCPQPADHCLTGETDGETIRVNLDLPASILPVVVLHELVHRLANSERWAHLNPVRTGLPRRLFLEVLAVHVTSFIH